MDREKHKSLFASLERSPWAYAEDKGKSIPGPFFFLIPGVPMPEAARRPREPRQPNQPWRPDPVLPAELLLLELRPYVDDGKHWVLLSNGRTERRSIDPALVERYNLKINPVLPKDGGEPPVPSATIDYTILGLLTDPGRSPSAITLRNRTDGASLVVILAETTPTAGCRWPTTCPPAVAGEYRIRDDLSVVSPGWGSPAELAAIGAVPVAFATADEAATYRSYVEEYTRYWRQYFDPVAMRLDDAPDGELELETFILPLLTGSPDPQSAAARYAALFGWRPLHPGPGHWVWKDGEISSSVFGTADHPRQPAYTAATGDFGLFEGVERLSVNMQLEGDGLRAAVRRRSAGK